MTKPILGCLALGLATTVSLQAWVSRPAGSPAGSRAPATLDTMNPAHPRAQLAASGAPTVPQRALLDRYCVTCHNERLKTAGLMLDTLDISEVDANAEVLEKVVRKLGTGQMPPPGRPRPDDVTRDTFVASLATALDHAAAADPNPGRPTAHRLNRIEYVNAIRDLLGLEIDGRALLPADDSSYGFDNNADVLSMSPALLARYMSAATKISRLAVADPAILPEVRVYRVSRFLLQEGRMSEELPFGTRGGVAIRHTFPVDGEYVMKIRLQRPGLGQAGIRGMEEAHQIEARLDRALLQRFSVGGEVTDGAYRSGIAFDPNDKAAERLHVYRMTADQHMDVRFAAKAGARTVGVAFLKEPRAPEGVLSPRHMIIDRAGIQGEPGVDRIEISGPYNPRASEDATSQRQVFVCRPTSSEDEAPCAKQILRTLARRAYRRPVVDADIEPLLGFYEAGRTAGGFEAGIQRALEALLVSPRFLFRIERDPAGAAPRTAYRLGDLDLASRLSFFLWSSIPDDELLEVAERGQLTNPNVLEQQVRRMLADGRSATLVSNFASQWLLVRNMRLATPDPELFVKFDDTLKRAFERETELFLEDQLREDRSVLDLFRADYTFVNDRLAEHYGIPNIYGSHFRRVSLTDPTRHGLLGQGSILTVTSYAHRTSVVKRGKWVLENILGAPPPPPPANVPPLEESEEGAQPTSLRERMEQHRKNPGCAACHARIDPLGFALENFDAIGEWRETDGGASIESTSTLADGTTVDGPVSLREALLAGDEIITNVIEQLLTYALGRGLEYYDAPAVREIKRNAAADDYRWSDLIVGVARSTPFLMRQVSSEDQEGPETRALGPR